MGHESDGSPGNKQRIQARNQPPSPGVMFHSLPEWEYPHLTSPSRYKPDGQVGGYASGLMFQFSRYNLSASFVCNCSGQDKDAKP